MGVKYLHELVESGVIPNSVNAVDLIKLAKSIATSKGPAPQSKKPGDGPKLCLVVDAECCLNRLYGGFYSDWACGGQWNRMVNFIEQLVKTLTNANIEIVVFFNGAIEPQRMSEWIAYQKDEYKKLQQILYHVNKKGTPPPKAWWTPPVGLRMALRMMLKQLEVNVVNTIDDHRQEVIAYCRENNFHGLIADDAEYIAFDPPRLFSATMLKLTYKGTLGTKEYVISEVMQELNLTTEKLCVLAALLGNYLLPDKDLKDVYKAANIDVLTEAVAETVVKKLAKYLDEINVSNDLDEIVLQIFGTDSDPRAPALKQSIQYYLDGTKDGFLRYRSVSSGKRDKLLGKALSNSDTAELLSEHDLDTTKLASEEQSDDKTTLNSYREAASCFNNGQDDSKLDSSDSCNNTVTNCDSSGSDISGSGSKLKPKKEKAIPVLPAVPHEVMRTVSERHSKGLMSPYIYQILSQGEIKLPVIMEDGKEIPGIYSFYKPARQMVYAIVFNLHHHKYMAMKNNTALDVDIRIKEWIFNKNAGAHKIEYVTALPVGWRVPTIQRLWFGTTVDDKRRRLRAFLTCMRSDEQLILNPDFVPQQLLVAAVVLRYMMSFPEKKVLRKPELDAFIVAALTPEFSNIEYTQEIQLQHVSSRGLQLAAMFMKGIEMALLVNDACGAPVPWLMCCPWLFFDGKLFHHVYNKANSVKNLQELCDGRLGLVMRTERMRQAILENLNVQFARPPMPIAAEDLKSPYSRPPYMGRMRMPPSSMSSIAAPPFNRPLQAGVGRGRRSLGGRLEIAGIVVGSWGANYNLSQPSYETPYLLPPQVASGGTYNDVGSYRPRTGYVPRAKGRPYKQTFAKKKPVKKEKKGGKGRGITVGSQATGNSLSLESSSDKSSKENGNDQSSSVESPLMNGDDLNLTDDRFDDAIINGAIEVIEDDGPKMKNLRDSGSVVGT